MPYPTSRHVDFIRPSFERWFGWSAILLCLAFFTDPLYADAAANDRTQQESGASAAEALDLGYQEFVERLFSEYLPKHPQTPATSLDQLAMELKKIKDPAAGIARVRANLDQLQRSPSIDHWTTILSYLYEVNDTATVKLLTDQLKIKGDPTAQSQNYFLLARYYEERQNWRGVLGALSKVNAKALDTGDNHYHLLLMGYALQNLKEHRKALPYYQQIPKTSPYYAHAKLNEGTANLRQGWWTEAHLEFERAIQALQEDTGAKEQRNRLLVVLGYSQLNYEFYRDARTTLRKVSLDSASANKALMGIGLAAAHQKDFAGAVNAFGLLSAKTPTDPSVDEAFLLLPFAYEETGDKAAAANAYQQAIQHYQNKTAELLSSQSALQNAEKNTLSQKLLDLGKRAPELFGGGGNPDHLLRNYQNLTAMRTLAGEVGLGVILTELQEKYQKYLRDTAGKNLEVRRAVLDSYLSQAKFGMARLYDAP